MKDLQTYINGYVKPLVEHGEVVNVHAVARRIQAAFPQHTVAHLAQLVFAAVVLLRGNAEWDES